MLDLDDRRFLRTEPRLLSLLQHYVTLSSPDREQWRERVSQWEGIEAPELARWFGRLIACEWLEMNELGKANQATACYRATPSGRKVIAEFSNQD